MINMLNSIFQIMVDLPLERSFADRSLHSLHLLAYTALCFVNKTGSNSCNEELLT